MPDPKPCPFCGEQLKRLTSRCWLHPENACILAEIDSEYGEIAIGSYQIEKWNRRVNDESNT